MTTCATHQAQCPQCKSPLMFVTIGYDDDRGNFKDEFCTRCHYEHEVEDGKRKENTIHAGTVTMRVLKADPAFVKKILEGDEE